MPVRAAYFACYLNGTRVVTRSLGEFLSYIIEDIYACTKDDGLYLEKQAHEMRIMRNGAAGVVVNKQYNKYPQASSPRT
jgi:hypothetical protein